MIRCTLRAEWRAASAISSLDFRGRWSRPPSYKRSTRLVMAEKPPQSAVTQVARIRCQLRFARAAGLPKFDLRTPFCQGAAC